MSLIGSLLILCTVPTWMPTTISTPTCHLRFWFLGLGFILIFGCLFAKAWRVVVILRASKKLKRVVISNWQVARIVLIFLGVEVILLIIYSAVGRPKGAVRVVDLYRPHFDYKQCSYDTAQIVTLAVLGAYKVGMIVYGCFLAFSIRKIPFKVFNESKVIGFTIYNVSFFSALTVAVQLAIKDNITTVFVLRSFGIMIGTVVTVGVIMIQKAFLVGLVTEDTSSGGSFASTNHGSVLPSTNKGSSSTWSTPSDVSDSKLEDHDALKLMYKSLYRKYRKLFNAVKDSADLPNIKRLLHKDEDGSDIEAEDSAVTSQRLESLEVKVDEPVLKKDGKRNSESPSSSEEKTISLQDETS